MGINPDVAKIIADFVLGDYKWLVQAMEAHSKNLSERVRTIASEFWSKYIASDDIGRLEMAKQLAEIVSCCCSIPDHDLRIHCLATYMKSYFDDLITYLEKTSNKE